MHRLSKACKSSPRILNHSKCSFSTLQEQMKDNRVNREVTRQAPLMMGSEAFVETLISQGVTDLFGIVGSAFMDSLDLFPDAGIRFISCQHEQNSAHMADGYTRVSNKHGVCVAQNGPGITNFLTGLAAAYWAHSPVVAITPECSTMSKGLGGFQEIDQIKCFTECTKWQANILNANRIPEMTSMAFDLAKYERGPTQVNIPRDFFYSELNNVTIPEPKNIDYPVGSGAGIAKACELISKAKNPCILVGGGVRIAGRECIKIVKDMAENIGIPVATTYLHQDSFPCSHEYSVGPLGYQGNMSAMKCINESDLVIAIGTRMNPFGTLPQYEFDYWPKNAKLIQIDIDQRKLGLTKNADVYIHGDCLSTVKIMSNMLKQMQTSNQIECYKTKNDRRDKMNKHKTEWKRILEQWTTDNPNPIQGKIKPRQALNELKKVLPKDVMVSTDIGNICSVANSYLEFDYEQEPSFLGAMTFGNCQYSLGAMMGAKVAQPNRFALSYTGDGAWGMTFNELLTCNRENIPITCVVFNNNQWGAEKKNQVLWFGDRYIGVNLRNDNLSFAEIAKAMGCEGIKCTNVDEVGDALLKGHDNQMNKNKTTVIEVMCTKELGAPFRRDAMKLPKRHLSKYKNTIQTSESQTGQPTDYN